MRHWFIFLFLLVVTNPYEGRGIDYGEDEPQLYEYENNYSIKVYGPEKNENEIEFDKKETERFIKKIDSILNYSPYVFED